VDEGYNAGVNLEWIEDVVLKRRKHDRKPSWHGMDKKMNEARCQQK